MALEPVARALWVCALALGLPLTAQAQRRAVPGAPPTQWNQFSRAFDSYARADSVVGGGAVIVRDGRVLAHHEYGLADRAAGEPIVEGTLYHWASITKTLTLPRSPSCNCGTGAGCRWTTGSPTTSPSCAK